MEQRHEGGDKVSLQILGEEHSRKKELFPKGPSQECASCVLAKKTGIHGGCSVMNDMERKDGNSGR